jgi:hypothetical protein
MKRSALDPFRRACLRGQILGDVVARLAVFLSMAALAQALVEDGQITMVAEEARVMPQERTGQGLL